MQKEYVKCNNCSSTIPVDPGYVVWCDKCGWNMNPHISEYRKDIKFRLYRFMGKFLSESLLKSMLAHPIKKNYFSIQRILAIIISLKVYIVSIALMGTLAIGGVYLIAKGTFMAVEASEYAFAFLGALCLFVLYLVMPKYKRHPQEYIDKNHFKSLFSLVDNICDKMGAPKIDEIILTDEYNAAYYQTAFKGKRILYIGLPLFLVLEKEEKIALLCHEIAHGSNNDSIRNRFILGAYRLLENWYLVAKSGSLEREVVFIAVLGPVLLILSPIRWIISKVILVVWCILAFFMWRDLQRSEYLADLSAASVSGKSAMISVLNKCNCSSSFWSVVWLLSRYGYSKNIFMELKSKISNIPDRELERIKRIEKEQLSSVDASHPPTIFRIEFIEKMYSNQKTISFSDEDFQQLENELLKVQGEVENNVLIKCKSLVY